MAGREGLARVMLAHDRSGPRGRLPLVLLHAGVADRRMWEPPWAALTRDHDVVRLDLRGFGESTERPDDGWSYAADVAATLAALGVERAHLVGASMGAGVAVEVALSAPGLVASLMLVSPGGSLIPRMTDQLQEFVRAEDDAMARGDLDAAAAANVDWWLAGPHRDVEAMEPAARGLVHAMQRRAFELTDDWDEIEEAEPDQPVDERLGEIAVPTLVLVGALDIDAIGEASAAVIAGVPGARLATWDDVAHLPTLERPADFVTLVEGWLATLA